MRLETISRLIASADFSDFRVVALRYLQLRGYVQPEVVDGWRDGGRDIRVFQLPPNPTPIAIQVSVERRWAAKLRADAIKAKQRLGTSVMTYVSSQRIPEADFALLADELWRSEGVTVRKIDVQSLAVAFADARRLGELLEILGIRLPPDGGGHAPPRSLREETAYAYLFFGPEVAGFRAAMVERAVLAALSADPASSRAELERLVSAALALADTQRPQVLAALDRLLQSGRVHRTPNGLEPVGELRESFAALRALRERDADELISQVRGYLGELRVNPRDLDELAEAVLPDLGALLLLSGAATTEALDPSHTRPVLAEALGGKVRHLEATLQAFGVSEGEALAAVETLTALTMDSAMSRHLSAGELFVSLLHMRTPELMRALGANEQLRILLDANVAMPMLTGVLYRPGRQRYFLAADHLYRLARQHSLEMAVPRDYLEEAAAHLMEARGLYAGLVEADADLRGSTNAFVAHYVDLRMEGSAPEFADYLAAFGLTPDLPEGPSTLTRDILMTRMEGLFRRYGVAVERLDRPSTTNLRRAEQALAFAAAELEVSRPRRVMEHDARTIAHLHDAERDPGTTVALCSWDRLASHVARSEGTGWVVINPAALGDLLAMVAPGDHDARIITPVVLAMSIADEQADAGARILDGLAAIEQGVVFDGELLRQALAFKRAYLAQLASEPEGPELGAAWARWKAGSGLGDGAASP